MSKSEFPPELIERCREKVWPTEHVDDAIVAILRESGHAKLVAALKRARLYVNSSHLKSAIKALPTIDSALHKAGSRSGSP